MTKFRGGVRSRFHPERESANGRFEVQSRGEHGPIGFTRLDLLSQSGQGDISLLYLSHPYLPYLRLCTRPLSHETIGGEKGERVSQPGFRPFLATVALLFLLLRTILETVCFLGFGLICCSYYINLRLLFAVSFAFSFLFFGCPPAGR